MTWIQALLQQSPDPDNVLHPPSSPTVPGLSLTLSRSNVSVTSQVSVWFTSLLQRPGFVYSVVVHPGPSIGQGAQLVLSKMLTMCSEVSWNKSFPFLQKYIVLAPCQAYKTQWATTAMESHGTRAINYGAGMGGSEQFFYTILHTFCSANHTFTILSPFVLKITKIIHTLLRCIKIKRISLPPSPVPSPWNEQS